MIHILVVEDDMDIREALETYLHAQGYRVTAAADGVEAIAAFRQGTPDLVLLDIMLPKVDGYGVLEVIRQTSQVPVILLTALDTEADQLKGFDLLADDYVTKPFSPKVLMRKVAAVLRRAKGEAEAAPDAEMRYKALRLDTAAHEAFLGDDPLWLTQTEYDLLLLLMTRQGQVLTRQQLLDQIWQYDFLGDTRVVDNHIKNLRKKLGDGYIETVRGVGYRVAKNRA